MVEVSNFCIPKNLNTVIGEQFDIPCKRQAGPVDILVCNFSLKADVAVDAL